MFALGPWEHQSVESHLREEVPDEGQGPDAALIVDGMAIPKLGEKSIGVARQWCGATGKVDNCQVTVNCTIARAGGEYPFLVLDATCVKVRRQGEVRSTAVLLAVGINEEGQREILGLHTALSETEEAWKSFLEQLSKRGLTGVEHVTSDRDRGLEEAIRQQLPGVIWTPCHAHLRRNVPGRYA